MMGQKYINRHSCNGVILFLMLIALAMVLITSRFVILPLLFFAVAAYILPILEHATGYLAMALTVCKNE